MAEFSYKAKDAAGRIKTGTVTAGSKAAAKLQLKKMRLLPISMKAVKLDTPDDENIRPILGKYVFMDSKGIQIQLTGEPKPSTKDLIIFTKQIATMIASGVPLIQSMGILAAQQRVPAFGRNLNKIRAAVENGSTLSDSMEAYPKIFDSLYIAMVRAGETSGSLDSILLKLTSYVEKAAKIKSQVKSALTYPMIVLFFAFAVVTGLLLFVVPSFADQFKSAGKPLPGITVFVIDCSDFLMEKWWVIVGALVGVAFAINAYSKTVKGRLHLDQLLLKTPIIGVLLQKIAVGRFCSVMAAMLGAGVNLLEALTICASSSGNKVIENFVLGVRAKIEQGAKISEPLSEGGLFPPMVVSMVAVGETTGALDEMLMKVSAFYEEEVDIAVKTMLSMIEPIMIVFIGGVVGFLVIAMYLPMFDMGGTIN